MQWTGHQEALCHLQAETCPTSITLTLTICPVYDHTPQPAPCGAVNDCNATIINESLLSNPEQQLFRKACTGRLN